MASREVKGGDNETHEEIDNKSEWRPPEEGWIKINCDRACISKTNEAAYGILARDSKGNVVASIEKKFVSVEAEVAEALAIKQVVKLVIEKRYQKVEIESDAKLIIDEINGRGRKGHGELHKL
ncbi:hypothetical protein CRYUN_Cryun03dG0100000 [Craigia yunnanensis]